MPIIDGDPALARAVSVYTDPIMCII